MSEGDAVYSPGLSRKKNAMMIISDIPVISGSTECCAMKAIALITAIRSGLTRLGDGSCFFQHDNIRVILKSTFPYVFKRGSLVPILADVCPTNHT